MHKSPYTDNLAELTHDPPIQKSYFIIASTQFGAVKKDEPLEIQLPPDFLNSRNIKHIVVRNVKSLVEYSPYANIKFHSTIVHENPWDDHFICFADEQLVKPKKYEWRSAKTTIKIWFTDIRNFKLTVDDYTIELLLIY
jgi:hypothetical protein